MLHITCNIVHFVIYLICMPSALGHSYQANPLYPCYNYYIYTPVQEIAHFLQSRMIYVCIVEHTCALFIGGVLMWFYGRYQCSGYPKTVTWFIYQPTINVYSYTCILHIKCSYKLPIKYACIQCICTKSQVCSFLYKSYLSREF